MDRFKITFFYTLPALLACALIIYGYHDRAQQVGVEIKGFQCEEIHESLQSEELAAANGLSGAGCFSQDGTVDAASCSWAVDICHYHETYQLQVSAADSLEAPETIANVNVERAIDFESLVRDVDSKIDSIFLSNAGVVAVMVLLPYMLMGYGLGTSERINLSSSLRMQCTWSNWFLKFLVALILALGWIYIANPDGRGASTLRQFFIVADIQKDNTLPIYIKSYTMTPVIAGFFGWYLHLIGYFFTKLIHHDVISTRVYSLLFKKFLITYGIALVLPETGLVDAEQGVAFFMFLIGMFPLTAMSMLIESVSKIGSGAQGSSGSLSALPGISRWQILRLEEEGVESMAALANISPVTVSQNLQIIERLTLFWVDIAQLYTIVGHDGYQNLKGVCLTASEFVKRAEEDEFVEKIRGLEGVSEASEIARLVKATFSDRMVADRSVVAS
ncbi:hypothetical protein [Teredinibacter purpureus]|uniref:hypothetical protein n=1 Tax=Teredinibacter purpureus TaxID=2731756 RepID=UPI0005F869F7|nr:hypothetical protein [Teredinibacter purpureus]